MFNKSTFVHYSTACLAPQAKILEFLVFQLEKNTYSAEFWGTHILRVCLGILKKLPQYAYKLFYAYKKNHVFSAVFGVA